MTEGKQVGFYMVAQNSDGGFDVISTATPGVVDSFDREFGVVDSFDCECDAVAAANLFSDRIKTESRSRRNQRGATRLY